MRINVQEYQSILEKSFSRAEAALLKQRPSQVAREIKDACDVVFASKTQAYREVLPGCLLIRITDMNKNIRLPYISLGASAFSGRSLDEKVINPLLQAKSVPCSRGPYLSVFRRKVKFDETTRPGLKDQLGYDAFLYMLEVVENEVDREVLITILDYILYRFVLLREQARVELIRLERVSLSQYKFLISGLLARSSGGFFPFVLVLAMVETIVQHFSMPWVIEFQGINVADKPSGAGGDIMVKEEGKILLTIEVTERSVDASRIQATFRHKIAATTIPDYVFLVHLERIGEEAKRQAEKYFTQGYDVNLVDIQE